MARVRLEVDPDTLIDTGQALRLVATEFESASDIVSDYTDGIGHQRLRDRLDEFQSSWDDKRGKMIEAITGIGEATEGVGTAFNDADNELYTNLTAEA